MQATRRRATIPVIICPECSALEPGAYIGDRTGDIITCSTTRFEDERGFIHCARCGLVWQTLAIVPEDRVPEADELPPTLFAQDHLGAGPGFNARDADDYRFFRNLARSHSRYVSPMRSGSVRRTCDRIYDSESLCTILDLPAAVKAAVVYHVQFLSERADWRELCAVRSNGKRVNVRSEAIIIATVGLVMERFNVERYRSLEIMVAAFSFTRPPHTISDEEYRAAYHSTAAWFGRKLWRDGPEDAPSGTHLPRRQTKHE